MKKTIYTLIVILLSLVLLVSAFMLGNYFLKSRQQAERQNALTQLKDEAKNQATQPTQPEKPDETKPTEPEATFGAEEIRDENGMLVEYGKIYEQNNDLVGWIRIDGTKIDYPVMQTPNNPNYYLKRNFDGESSDWGAIYAREECDINEPSDNITIYGHNMMDGSMFQNLNAYENKATWENNPLIFFDTLYEYHVYKIFAVFKTTASVNQGFKYHNMIDAESKEDFDKFIKTCKDLSFYDTGITPEYGDKIICLSTCEYTLENGRLVVAAVRIS